MMRGSGPALVFTRTRQVKGFSRVRQKYPVARQRCSALAMHPPEGPASIAGRPPTFHPMKKRNRLSAIAKATAVASIPEVQESLLEDSEIELWS